MTVFDEIKQKMHEAVDKAVDALHGTHDLDAARPIAQATTAALQAQALQVEAQLINHVAGNAAEVAKADSAPAEAATGETPAKTETPEDPVPPAADKTTTASGKKASK